MENELTRDQAAIVKALRIQGIKQQDISALFGVNQRAVNHILNFRVYRDVSPNFKHGLPLKMVTMPKIEMIEKLQRN